MSHWLFPLVALAVALFVTYPPLCKRVATALGFDLI
jgi:hypothetical protein